MRSGWTTEFSWQSSAVLSWQSLADLEENMLAPGLVCNREDSAVLSAVTANKGRIFHINDKVRQNVGIY